MIAAEEPARVSRLEFPAPSVVVDFQPLGVLLYWLTVQF